ncbi:MAG: ATP-binding protein [Pedobacter agri]
MQDQSTNIIIVVIVSMLLMLILVVFIIFIFFHYQKRYILYYNNIAQLKLEYEKNLLTAQLEIQENTLLNISQEIHDNIGLSLTLAKLNLNSVEIEDKNKSLSLVSYSGELITKAINDLSDLSKSFNAEVIMNQGFLYSIEHEIHRIKKHLTHKIAYNITGEPYHIDSKIEILLFRIFQESLNNIIKHASASEISIKINYMVNEFIFTVIDNGKGFDLDEILANKKSRAGLKNIKKRAALIQAKAEIESKLNIGTSITITIPNNPSI